MTYINLIKPKRKKDKSNSAISLWISLSFHLFILLTLRFVLIEKIIFDDEAIYVELNEFKKENIVEKSKQVKTIREEIHSRKVNKQDVLEEKVIEENLITVFKEVENQVENDTISYSNSFQIILDSLIFQNPSIAVLKIVIAERLKHKSVREIEFDEARAELHNQLLAQYNFLYPVKQYHFNIQNSSGISIPIDKIIDLFN